MPPTEEPSGTAALFAELEAAYSQLNQLREAWATGAAYGRAEAEAECERLREALQQILDLACPVGQEGDLLVEALLIARRALSGGVP